MGVFCEMSVLISPPTTTAVVPGKKKHECQPTKYAYLPHPQPRHPFIIKNVSFVSGSRYNTEEVASRQERKEVRARASAQALSRGGSGCAMSPVEMARAMAGLLRMHQSEFEMQVTRT